MRVKRPLDVGMSARLGCQLTRQLLCFSQEHAIGNVRLRHGKLEDPLHREFLTKEVDVAFCNNYNHVFGDKSQKAKPTYPFTLDDYVAGLFCLMKPGAVLVTLERLQLGLSRKDANRARQKHGLHESEQASFFEMEEIVLAGRDLLSWRGDVEFSVFKYTRIGDAKFFCCNPACKNSRTMVAIQAWRKEDEHVIANCCRRCKREEKGTRKRKVPDFFVAKRG